ncbi:MAG: hypothetical protein ABI763_11305 [Bacteroidota bacterium]
MNKSILKLLILIILFSDLGHSFVQHYHKPLDGDMANIVLGYPEVMSDPFGLNVILEHKVYGGTNRFFAHWMMSVYFKHAPQFFQNFVSPVESIYLSCAAAKIVIQLLIIFSLAYMISGTKKIWNKSFLLAAALVTPLFQTNGYERYMGIIGSSITYTFFYSLPFALLMLFLLPFFKRVTTTWENMNILKFAIIIISSLVLSLGGPLSAAVILIGCALVLLSIWKNKYCESQPLPYIHNIVFSFWKIPHQLLMLLLMICIICFYSLYLGQFNAENFINPISLAERYKSLPTGLYYIFTQKLGLSLLLFMILLNLFLVSKKGPDEKGKLILIQVKWIALFALIYIVLLPLGGYRQYRPNIVRSDTLLPVIMIMIYMFGVSAYYLLNIEKSKLNILYYFAAVILLSVFVIADKSISTENDCEKDALKKIAQSSEIIVPLDNNCTVMSWEKITDCNNSKLNCELLKLWGVLKDDKCYFQY